MSELQVGSNEDLVLLLQDAVDLQEYTGNPLPLLVDENIHYRVARLLYGSPYKEWHLAKKLQNVPVLYGVWHAYKHTLTILYRTYFAVLGILDSTGQPRTRAPVSNKRRVLYMEKMFAVLYLLRRELLPGVKELLRTSGTGPRADQASSSRDPVSEPGGEEGGFLGVGSARVGALRDLLEFYAPAMLRLGFLVRQCTWSGGPHGSVKGDTALEILRECLLLQVHLQQDWEAQQEYTRTIGVALLMWQPWMTALPGCAFVEESGEALLSRYTSACRNSRHLQGYANAWRLYVTLPQTRDKATATRGSVRSGLLTLFRSRILALMEDPVSPPHPKMSSATTGTWEANAPAGLSFPGIPSHRFDSAQWRTLLEGVLGLLSTGPPPATPVVARLDACAERTTRYLLSDRRHCHEQLRQWAEARRTRVRIANAILRPPDARAPRGRGRTAPPDGAPPGGAAPAPAGEADEVVLPPSASQSSDTESESAGGPRSEDYHSPGCTDGLGSLGRAEESDDPGSEGGSPDSEGDW